MIWHTGKNIKTSFFHQNKKKDTLTYLDIQDVKNFIKNDKGFQDANISWFPPYLKKVKKIDYKKFIEYSKKLEGLNLKKPTSKDLSRNFQEKY
ncbi:hypothetical protein JJC04_01980 [Flavobacterium covae]|nr:hypothetical protein [Flavobacterium covae]QYS91566.1 hypothetical protein JJC04_01890 [Flavobacterium covae]QYS91584.1 hypothetical protein JJC04_01980 [Flavobacterium covae]